MITTLPGLHSMKPGFAGKPLPGISADICDHQDSSVQKGGGLLSLTEPWPSMARGIWGDNQRFKDVYWSQLDTYFTGDGAVKDKDGYFMVLGRVDDVIIVSGHNLGTAEIEGAIGGHSAVAEAAVVGYDHEIKGNAIYAYVTLKTGEEVTDTLAAEIVKQVRTDIGPHASPEKIQFTPGLPKTRSGKIMRRILRKIAEGDTDNLGDTSTLADPDVVESLVAGRVE